MLNDLMSSRSLVKPSAARVFLFQRKLQNHQLWRETATGHYVRLRLCVYLYAYMLVPNSTSERARLFRDC